jgi:transcriptional regulator with XRE-family HTH domain
VQLPSSPPNNSNRNRLISRAFYDPIIDQLIEARKQRGITQVELDDIIECAEKLVSKWECRERYPSSHYLALWASALGLRFNLEPDE